MISPQKMNDAESLQGKLFKQIRQQLPAHLSLADVVGEALGISSDSVYRRLRGETSLTLEEASKLATHFGIALQEIFGASAASVSFRKVGMRNTPGGFNDYLQTTRVYFEEINKAKQKQGFYAAKDIPVFYYFLFPDLARFKIFFWLKTIKEVETLKDEVFAPLHIPDEYIQAGLAIAYQYLQTPCTEIWNDETPNSTLRQIEYYYEAGMLEKASVARQLLDALEALITHIQQQATKGFKLHNGLEQAAYELYFNEILLMDNTIFVQADGVSHVLLSYNATDYLYTTDTAFGAEVQTWLHAQRSKSALISSVSEKERNRFFNKIYSRIQAVRQKMH
jgi:hypothetical protein